MKEATGELNMTVITLVAVAAVGALFYFVIWPVIQRMVMNQTCSTYGSNWGAEKVEDDLCPGVEDNEHTDCWVCCPIENDQVNTNSPKCIRANN